jgi:hypothetical protein
LSLIIGFSLLNNKVVTSSYGDNSVHGSLIDNEEPMIRDNNGPGTVPQELSNLSNSRIDLSMLEETMPMPMQLMPDGINCSSSTVITLSMREVKLLMFQDTMMLRMDKLSELTLLLRTRWSNGLSFTFLMPSLNQLQASTKNLDSISTDHSTLSQNSEATDKLM